MFSTMSLSTRVFLLLVPLVYTLDPAPARRRGPQREPAAGALRRGGR